jgi:hypothetical protein
MTQPSLPDQASDKTVQAFAHLLCLAQELLGFFARELSEQDSGVVLQIADYFAQDVV